LQKPNSPTPLLPSPISSLTTLSLLIPPLLPPSTQSGAEVPPSLPFLTACESGHPSCLPSWQNQQALGPASFDGRPLFPVPSDQITR
jgi:hypothetical protein